MQNDSFRESMFRQEVLFHEIFPAPSTTKPAAIILPTTAPLIMQSPTTVPEAMQPPTTAPTTPAIQSRIQSKRKRNPRDNFSITRKKVRQNNSNQFVQLRITIQIIVLISERFRT